MLPHTALPRTVFFAAVLAASLVAGALGCADYNDFIGAPVSDPKFGGGSIVCDKDYSNSKGGINCRDLRGHVINCYCGIECRPPYSYCEPEKAPKGCTSGDCNSCSAGYFLA